MAALSIDLPRLGGVLSFSARPLYVARRVAPASGSDEALMAAYAAGDRRAFEELFRRLSGPVHGFFLRSFRDGAVADDLLQTTFMKLHRARADYQPDLPLRPWLFSIAGRVRLDALRKRYRMQEDADEERLAAADEAQAMARAREVEAEAGGRAASVREALDELPESQRTVVHLHRYEGLTFGEIARALGTTEAAVKLRAFRAYERLRVSLAHLVEEEGAV
jgi:RNA polymerase sigma factor (sigma-70 family)